METFKKITADIDCDPQPGGHLYIAHKAKAMPALEKEAKVMREIFHYDARILDADTVRREYVDDKEAAGALHEPEGIGIHAGKLAFGYLRKARALGAKVHPSSPVMGWETRNGVHYLQRRAAWCAPAVAGYGRLHLAPSASASEEPFAADFVELARHASADPGGNRGVQLPHSPDHGYAHPAPLLPLDAGQPRADRQPQRHHGSRCAGTTTNRVDQ
jgi:glycine/D-amino acid oxidase-like deaminating enzyme